MKYLFDSNGRHIANEVAGQLHALDGSNIGRFLAQQRIFIDRSGRYLGEIVGDNRLMCNPASAFESVRFGRFGDAGNAGSYGNPGNAGSVAAEGGFVDIPEDRLK
jgi:hypothetical protein